MALHMWLATNPLPFLDPSYELILGLFIVKLLTMPFISELSSLRNPWLFADPHSSVSTFFHRLQDGFLTTYGNIMGSLR